MQRRGFLAALGALVVGGTIGKVISASPVDHEHAATARAVYGNSGMRLARGGVIQPREFYLVGESACELRPAPPQNILADRRGHDDDQVIEWVRGTETPNSLRWGDIQH
jgi:hypothetical protein